MAFCFHPLHKGTTTVADPVMRSSQTITLRGILLRTSNSCLSYLGKQRLEKLGRQAESSTIGLLLHNLCQVLYCLSCLHALLELDIHNPIHRVRISQHCNRTDSWKYLILDRESIRNSFFVLTCCRNKLQKSVSKERHVTHKMLDLEPWDRIVSTWCMSTKTYQCWRKKISKIRFPLSLSYLFINHVIAA